MAPLINHAIEDRAGQGQGEKLTMSMAALGYVFFIVSLQSGSFLFIILSSLIKVCYL